MLALGLPWRAALAACESRMVNLNAQLQAIVDTEEAPLAGLSVLVKQAGVVVHEAQFGRRYIDPATPEADLPVTPDTLFRVASITKLAVSLCALRLADAGLLDLDADVGEILGYRIRHPNYPTARITPRLLMSHRSGFSDAGNDLLDGTTDLRALLFEMRDASGARNPWSKGGGGDYFEYSNLNFVVLAAAMERVTHSRFDALMRTWLLEPLDMVGGFDPARLPAQERAQLATLYRKAVNDESTWSPAGPWYAQTDDRRGPDQPALDARFAGPYLPGSRPGLFGPQGGLRTRVRDLAKLADLLLGNGQYDGRTILQRARVQAMLQESWRSNMHQGAAANGDDDRGTFQAWGLGVQHFIDRSRPGWGDRLLPGGGVTAWGHLGFAYGLVAGVFVEPVRATTVIYVISGTGDNPDTHPGEYSSFARWEERVLALLWASAGYA